MRLIGSKIFISGGEHDLTRQHRAPGAGAPARRTARHQGHLAVPGAEVPARRLAQRHPLRRASRRRWASRAAPPARWASTSATGWLIGQPHRGLAAMFVMMNSARLHVAHAGPGPPGSGAAERAGLRARARIAAAGGEAPIAAHPAMRRTLWRLRALAEGAACHRLLDRACCSTKRTHHPEAARRAQADKLRRPADAGGSRPSSPTTATTAPTRRCRSSAAMASCTTTASSRPCATAASR